MLPGRRVLDAGRDDGLKETRCENVGGEEGKGGD